MIQAQVERVDITPDESLIWLRCADPEARMPIVVGRTEADSIQRALEGDAPPRPMTHDLFDTVLRRTGNRLERVVVSDLRDNTFFARLQLVTGGRRKTVDARPSDAIALALRASAPIFLEEDVLAGAGQYATSTLPLPDKPVHKLTKRELRIFRKLMGFEQGGGSVAYPTAEETEARTRRERWKKRYAGKGSLEPCLLIRDEQIRMIKGNAKRSTAARKWHDGILRRAEEASGLPDDFFDSFIPDQGPWNPGGNFCPNCVHKKSPEGINNFFWKWDWRDPDRLECPYCGMVYPNKKYPDNGFLRLPRLNKVYSFHILKEELETEDWHLGEKAGRFVGQPIHVSFSGNIRSMKIRWALAQVEPLGIAFALTGKAVYARTVERILSRMADVYPGYPLQSYFQDVVDADPGYATDHADGLPTVFKRNASISVYDGRYGYGQEKTTTRTTRVATGLWGSSRISQELTTTGVTFLKCFQAYDLVKKAIVPEVRRRLEQNFLLELYLDTRAYEYVTNKAGSIRAARVAFGLVYGSKKELNSGLEGFRKIIESQFHPDGSMKESPIYGHKPIGEDLWQIPEMLRGTQDLYGEGLYRSALQALADIPTPLGTWPTLDDSFMRSSVPQRTADIAQERCGITAPGPSAPPSEFAIQNVNLGKRKKRPASGPAVNHYYEGRHLACLGYGSGARRVQLYALGEDGLRGHRHAGALSIQLYADGREIFPDLGYICDHPGNQWVKATASHQTVVVDGGNSYPAEPSRLLGFHGRGSSRYVDMAVLLKSGVTLRRALTLLRKEDGLPILVDILDATGPGTRDYNMRVNAPPGRFSVDGANLKARPRKLYQDHSFYPLVDFQTAGKADGGWQATWGSGRSRVQGTFLSPCSELITYRSPGWRSQFEITAEPEKYFDTIVMRDKGRSSRFIAVYEVCSGTPKVRAAACEDRDEAIVIDLDMGKGSSIEVVTPGAMENSSERDWAVKA